MTDKSKIRLLRTKSIFVFEKSEWVVVLCQLNNFSAISCREQVNFQWGDDKVRFALDQHV